MNARTCQLCGKPLSRLWAGSDGDFCSKEHRNQFRLRRGMDRLVEVNKVASLMRRRENPRQIAYTRLMCQSAINPRGFFRAQPTNYHTTPFTYEPQYAAFGAPRITAHAETLKATEVPRLSGQASVRRPDNNAARIRPRASRIRLPRGNWEMEAQVAQAPARTLRRRTGPEPQRREFNLLRRSGIRVHVGKGPSAFQRFRFTGTEALRRGVVVSKPASMAVVGNALRVSIGRGFTLPTLERRAFQSKPSMHATLVYPKRSMPLSPPLLDRGSKSRGMTVGSTAIFLRLPPAPPAKHSASFQYPGTLPQTAGAAMQGSFPPSRFSGISWSVAGARWNPAAIDPPEAGFARRNGLHLLRLMMTPTGLTSAPQVVFSPFIPQEPLGCPVVQFQGTIAGASPTVVPVTELPQPEPVVMKPAPVAVQYEEHFDGGWDNWVGGVADWKVDVAGVRTGSMALFMPTLDLTDYELEFLARIDSKSLNWVVRAAGLEEHLRCTLTALPGNELEFSRTLVKGGVTEGSVVSATRAPGKPRAAMTVKTQVSGNTFSVTVDGKTIETWTESRLPSGGVGFSGTADDRARLYWVRVSSSQTSGKE
jgi:hypothetical protein